MAAASPRCWGRGVVSYFAVALLRRLAAAILGWRAWRAARGTKWRRSRATTQARRRLSRPRGAGGGKKATLFGVFYPMLRLGKGRPVGP